MKEYNKMMFVDDKITNINPNNFQFIEYSIPQINKLSFNEDLLKSHISLLAKDNKTIRLINSSIKKNKTIIKNKQKEIYQLNNVKNNSLNHRKIQLHNEISSLNQLNNKFESVKSNLVNFNMDINNLFNLIQKVIDLLK